MADAMVGVAGFSKGGEGERRQVTVLFTDLVGSTALASSLDPEDWHEVLRSYHRRVAEIVADHGGFVRQFQGDGALAFFGYPAAVETSGRDAVGAALEVVAAIAQLGATFDPALGVSGLRARAGIDTGLVIVAPNDSLSGEKTPDVFGEAPNLASRLQSAADPGQVIVSAATASLAEGFYELEPLPPLSLKGLPRSITAYRVLGASGARTRLQARPLIPFVARNDELAWLQGQWAGALGGPARCVLVTGDPGIGKSRLVHEFSRLVDREGGRTVTAYCNAADFLSPLQPFGQFMGAIPSDPALVEGWVERETSARPTMLAIDDVHWADPSTLEVVDRLAGRDLPLLIVLTARPQVGAEAPVPLPACEHLVLDRLLPAEAMAVVEGVAGGAGLSGEVARTLVERADGVPLYLEELTRTVVETGLKEPTDIPVTIAEVITARLDRVGGAKGTAQMASVIGREFERSLIAEVSGTDPDVVDDQLRRLAQQALIEPPRMPGEPLRFRHALIHEAAYRSLTRSDRRAAHSRVADALIGSSHSESQPQVVARHLGSAGRYSEAAEMWRQASRLARRNSRFREAAAHERELLRLIPDLPLSQRDLTEMHARRRLAICLTTVDQSTPEALAEAERALELARRLGEDVAVLELHLVLVPWWQAQADYASIDQALPGAIELAGRVDNPWFGLMLTLYRATMQVWQGRLPEALAHLAVGWSRAGIPLDSTLCSLPPSAGLQVLVLASLRMAAALAFWLSGEVRMAWVLAEDALQFAAERRVPPAQAVTSATAAILAQLDGDRERAARLARAAEDLPDEVATLQWRRWAAIVRWWAGHGAEMATLPGPMLRPYFLLLRADGAGIPAGEAITILGEALMEARATGERFCEAEILRARARAWHQAGQIAKATADLVAAQETARAQRARSLELRVLNDRVQLLGDRGALVDIRRLLDAIGETGPRRDVELAIRLLSPLP